MMRRFRPFGGGGGMPKPAKIRRTKEQAYGESWAVIRERVKKRDGYKCCLCGRCEFLQVDHIIPVAKGGVTAMHNLWTLCDLCHAQRPGHSGAKNLILNRRKKAGLLR